MRKLILFLLLAPILIAAEEPDPFFLERVLPESTLLYVSIPNSAAVSEDFPKTSLYKLIHHPEVQSFLEPLRAYMDKMKKEKEEPDRWLDFNILRDESWKKKTGLTFDEIWGLAQGPISFAILDVPVNEEHKLDLVLAVGNPDLEKLKDAASKVQEAVKRQSQSPIESESTFRGVTIRAFGSRETTIYYAALGKTTVFTTQEARLQHIIVAQTDKSARSLEKSAAFADVRKRISPNGRHFFLAYANAPAILRNFRKEIGDDAMKTLDRLGVSDLAGIGAGLAFDGPYVREKYWLGTSAQTRGIPRLLAGKPTPNVAAKLVPQGAVQYGHFGIDLMDLYDSLLEGLTLDPKAKEEFEKELGKYEARVGIKVRDDLLASIGDRWTLAAAFPPSGGAYPDGVYIVPLRDAAKFEACLRKIFADLKLEVRESPFRGVTIRHVNVSLEEASREFRGGPAPSFPVVWCIRAGCLFLSSSAHAVKRLATYSGKSIEDDPKFREAKSRLPGEPDALLYADFGRLFTCAYNTLEPIAHFFREFVRDRNGEVILDLARLPLGESLGELIGTSCSVKRTETSGILFESVSSLGVTPVTLTVAMGAGAAALLMGRGDRPSGGVAENERVAQTRLKWIAQAQEVFKDSDSDGNLIADYWTRDVAGLYALKNSSGQFVYLIDPQTAYADTVGAFHYDEVMKNLAQCNGYYFVALETDPDGEKYGQDPDKDGNAWTNGKKWAVCAYPSLYGAEGRMTFLLNEEGNVYKKDTEGRSVTAWPGKHPAQEGWTLAD